MKMKNILITMFGVTLSAPLFADGTNPLPDERSRNSYAIGANYGHYLKQQGVTTADVDVDVLFHAIKDVLAGNPELMTDAEGRNTLQNFVKEIRAKAMSRAKAEGESFLATNKLTPGIKLLNVALPGGRTNEMQYLIITNGSGPVPAAGDRVSMHYRGTFVNGTEFNSSYRGNAPIVQVVANIPVPGWSEALQHMPVGSKWKLFLPSELGYGERGSVSVPPNSALIYEVELLSIEPPAPPPAPAAPVEPLSSDVIKVPSADEMKKGAKIEVIKSEDVRKLQEQQQSAQTNQAK